MHMWQLMTDSVACYERRIKLSTVAVHLLFCTNLSKCVLSSFTHPNLATPQAESKLENTEGNRNQERCCLANMPNHGQLSGVPALSDTVLLVHEEDIGEEMKPMSGPRWQL